MLQLVLQNRSHFSFFHKTYHRSRLKSSGESLSHLDMPVNIGNCTFHVNRYNFCTIFRSFRHDQFTCTHQCFFIGKRNLLFLSDFAASVGFRQTIPTTAVNTVSASSMVAAAINPSIPERTSIFILRKRLRNSSAHASS